VKLTTRGPRDYEYKTPPRDLQLNCTHAAVNACDYTYAYQKDMYGVPRQAIDKILQRGDHAILIARDGRTIQQLRQDYQGAVLTFWLQSALSGKDLEKKLKELGYRDLAAEQRLRRSEADFRQYVDFIDLYDKVLINWYDDTLFEQLNRVLYDRSTMSRTTPRTGAQ